MSIQKKYIVFLFVSLLVINNSFAEVLQTTTHKLNWTGIEKWSTDSNTVHVLAFKGAQYPNDNRLPNFNYRVKVDKSYSYTVELLSASFSSLTEIEKSFLEGIVFGNQPRTSINIISARDGNYLDVSILPFAVIDGQLQKLDSFNLQINKSATKSKAPSIVNHTFTSNSILSSGKFVKIMIANSGVYKLSYEDLKAMGIEPANVKIFGYGGAVLEQSFMSPKIDDLPEQAIYMEKGTDGVFNAGDYILFYAQGVVKWWYDTSNAMFVHANNPYSKYGYYYVTSDKGEGKRISSYTPQVPVTATVHDKTEFVDYDVYEKDAINLISSGKEFYGEVFRDVTSVLIPYSFPNIISTNGLKTRLDVAASAQLTSYFTLNIDGTQAKALAVPARSSDYYEKAKVASSVFTFSPNSSSFVLNLTYTKSESSSVGYLNYVELNARRRLIMSGSVMQFQNVDNLYTGVYNRYKLTTTNRNVQIWNITNPTNISSLVTEQNNDTLSFIEDGAVVKNFLAIDPTASASFPKPQILGVVPNQNLHAVAQSDMVIITHPAFKTQAEVLAQAHRTKDNLSVTVATTEEVYNEFSSGTPDATAYRWIMKMLYDRALEANNASAAPKYLLLFGRGTFDNRKILNNSGDNLVLTYQTENSTVVTLSYVTDDYYALLDDNEGSNVPSGLMDIAVGRIPARTVQEASDAVTKTIGFMENTNKGGWKNQLCFVADDGDNALHAIQADKIAESININYPAYQVNKIFLDAFNEEITASGQRYPVAESKLQNLLRSGLLLLNYTGHAGSTGWSSEAVLSIADVKALSNKNLPIWVAATCDFIQFDVQTMSAGEFVLLNPSGGGIGILAAARPVYSSPNFTLNKLFCENLFAKVNGKEMTIGEVLMKTKNNVGTDINKLSYLYLGDPAVRLNYPTKYNINTSQINENTTLGNDTLRALSVTTVKGFISDENGNKVSNFNGKVRAIVFDKIQSVTSLNNEKDGAITFNDRPNTLFSGNADVVNGEFSFSFMLPKDIKYNYGTGRINYYAQDDINNNEAQGYFENFYIGGTNHDFIDENEGPQVELYLNSDKFSNGDKVNETPMFIAQVTDINGINTVGSGIGHDVTLIVDNDPSQTHILNDYFLAATNSYTKGQISYKMPELVNGKHTLTFRVWDLLNNSTTKTIEFEVQKGLTPVIFNVYNYPNPVKNQTNFVIEHDRPETILKTTVEIFDIAGRKVWEFNQASAQNIQWDAMTSNGQKLKAGIYLYRINIKTTNSNISSKTNKLLIVEQ